MRHIKKKTPKFASEAFLACLFIFGLNASHGAQKSGARCKPYFAKDSVTPHRLLAKTGQRRNQ